MSAPCICVKSLRCERRYRRRQHENSALTLQLAGELLDQAQQTSEEQREVLQEFQDVLAKKEVLAHKDKVCAVQTTPCLRVQTLLHCTWVGYTRA